MTDFIDDDNIWKEDLFAVLGVQQETSVSDIRKIYINLTKEYHPDKFVNDKAAYEEAVTKFSKITVAYKILIDPQKREYYLELRRILKEHIPEPGQEQTKPKPKDKASEENTAKVKEQQAESFFNKAQNFFNHHDYDTAINELEKAINICPDTSKYHTYLGRIYKAKGWSGMAAASFKKALDLNPNDAIARKEITQSKIQDKVKREKTNIPFWKRLFGKK